MDNPEKLATYVTQDEEKQNKNTTHICVGHYYTQTNKNNIKTWALLRDKQLEVKTDHCFMRTSQHGTRNTKTHNRTAQKTIKKNESHGSHQKTEVNSGVLEG